MNYSQYTRSLATSQSHLLTITRIGCTLRRTLLNSDRYPVLGRQHRKTGTCGPAIEGQIGYCSVVHRN